LHWPSSHASCSKSTKSYEQGQNKKLNKKEKEKQKTKPKKQTKKVPQLDLVNIKKINAGKNEKNISLHLSIQSV
jgi:hypothetical protein